MGNRYGKALYKHGFRVQAQPNEKLDFARRSEDEVKRVFPQILDEIRGFADACGAPYEQFEAFVFGAGAFKVQPMCSIFAAASDSDVIFARNHDFYYSFMKTSESFLTSPKDGYRSLGHSDVLIGREDGINEKGLAIGMSSVDVRKTRPGISLCLALRCVLDTCANVKEGIRILSNAHFTSTGSFLLADKGGDMAAIEASVDRVRVRGPEDGESFIVCADHFVHPEMVEVEGSRSWDSVPRYAAMHSSLKACSGRVNIRAAQRIMANHAGYVCSHQEEIQLGTLWSIVVSLEKPQIFRAEGHPCNTKYEREPRLNKAIERHVDPEDHEAS